MNATTTPRLRLGRNPYMSGINARDAGHPIEACPVTPRSRHYRLWRSGWLARDVYLACFAPKKAAA